MLHRLRKHVPRFSIASLLLLTTAFALGFAVSQSPPLEQIRRWQYIDPAYRGFSQKFITTGSLLIAFEYLRQSWFLWILRDKVPSHERFSILWALFLRVGVSSAIFLLTLLRLLLNQDILIRVEDEGYNYIFGTLWPDIVLDLVLVVAVRMLLVKRDVIQSVGIRCFRNAVVIVGLIGALTYIVTERALVLAFVHIAVDSVESSHGTAFQRPGVYPNHASEGFQSFWQAATAAAAVLGAVFVLLWCTQSHKVLVQCVLCAAFLGLLASVASYVHWFAAQEYHRISPELADVGLASQWGKVQAGLLLSVGIALYLATRSAARATKRPLLVNRLPHASVLAIVGALVIAMASGSYWFGMFRDSLSGAAFLYGSGTLQATIRSIGSSLLYPEHMIPLALFISATSLVWQMFRDPQAAPKLLPLEPWRLTGYTIAWLLLILVAIPTFAIFGFCYWIGPCVL